MKKFIFLFLTAGINLSCAYAQNNFEGFSLYPKFDSLQKHVGRVTQNYKMYFEDRPMGYQLPKVMTETEGVSIANFLIQSPKDFNLRRDVQNMIPVRSGAIFIRYISGRWQIGYQRLKDQTKQLYLFGETRIFWLNYE